MTLEELLRQGKSFGQGASNAAASTVTGPVDMLAWLLRKGGVDVGEAPIGGEAWMRQKGLMATPENRLAGLLGEGAGLAAPIVAAAKAPEIAGGLLQMGRNLATPQTLNKQTGAIVYHGSPHKFDKFDSSKIGTGEGAQAYGHGIYTGGNIKTGKEYVKTTARTEVIDSSGNTLYKELPKRKVTGESRAADALDYAFQIQSSNPYAFAANQVRRFGEGPNVQDALKTLEQWEKSGARTRSGGGYLYKADLPDEKIAQMIDWYYPVQEDVRQKVSSAALQKFGSGSTGTSGAHLYAELSKEFERIGAAKFFSLKNLYILLFTRKHHIVVCL